MAESILLGKKACVLKGMASPSFSKRERTREKRRKEGSL
jgi:hypothetical protein